MKSVVQSLAQEVVTKDKLALLIRQLEESQSLLFSQKQAEKTTLKNVPHFVSPLIPDSVVASQQALDEWLGEVIAGLRKLPVATITIAYLPTEAQAQELIQLVRSGFSTHVVIELVTDPSLLAGVRIEYDTQRIQYSLKDDLDEALKELNV